MDKYSKTLLMIFRVPFGIFCILMGLALIGISVWVSTFSDVASMIFLISFLGGGFLINYGVGFAFLGDEYKVSNFVREGNSTFEVIETPKLLKRRMVVTLIAFIAYIILAVYYVVRMIVEGAIVQSLTGTFVLNWVLLVFAAIAVFIAIVFFLFYKKTRHIDLKSQN